MITKKLAIFIGSSNIANSVVENVEFKDLLHTYAIPSRVYISRELDKVFIELKAKFGSCLQSANKASITANIWSILV